MAVRNFGAFLFTAKSQVYTRYGTVEMPIEHRYIQYLHVTHSIHRSKKNNRLLKSVPACR
ncbi:MAG: hypothetical protein LBK58_03940 [Prevotellaceae bacterium]|jgi:hypothetical protein|nr:hypothetical protein [Prevotellaceae bacterium]